jgi:quercetin dioxygenase-like cupin family protein
MGNNAANNNGFYEEKTKTAQPIQKSNVMNVPANTEHWHGATAKSKMAISTLPILQAMSK